MTPETIFAFTLAMIVLAATPGPGFFAVIAQALSKGVRPAFMLLSGVILADMVFIIAVAFGLGLLAKQMGDMFHIIRLAGAVYLVFLGWQAWKSPVEDEIDVETSSIGWKSFLAGFLITIGNPKAIFFYVAFLPTFINMATISSTDISIMCFIAVAVSLIVEGTYIFAANKVSKKLKSVSARKALNRLCGSVLIGAGALIGLRP